MYVENKVLCFIVKGLPVSGWLSCMFRGPKVWKYVKKYLPNDAMWIMLETGKTEIADCAAFEHIYNKIYVL